ncbi:MAG: IS630 family transposase [Actinomycetota bacterium]
MRENDGRKLDHKTLEQMRFRAVDAVAAGQHPEDVAAALGMTRSAVYGWLAKYREGGKAALAAKPVPGRPPKLSAAQMQQVYRWVVGGDPRQYSFDFALWTRDLVRQLIRQKFDVALSAVSVGRLLKALGLSPQRPIWRAWQQDEQAVAAWRTERFPAIQAEAKKVGATIYFADEAGLRSDYHAGTTWAARGRTPVVKTTGSRHSVNMVSAVTAKGVLRFATYTGSFTADTFLDFCRRLMRDTDGPVFLVVDGHPTHKSKKVKAFAEASNGQLRIFTLPGYSPELNPDEWVWKNVKADRVGRAGITDKDDLKAKAVAALRRLQRMPHIIRGFFADPNLAYITATS